MLQHLPSMPHKEQPEVNPLTVLQLGLAQTMEEINGYDENIGSFKKKMIKKMMIVHACVSLLYVQN